jgi:hypothetical protein
MSPFHEISVAVGKLIEARKGRYEQQKIFRVAFCRRRTTTQGRLWRTAKRVYGSLDRLSDESCDNEKLRSNKLARSPVDSQFFIFSLDTRRLSKRVLVWKLPLLGTNEIEFVPTVAALTQTAGSRLEKQRQN